MIDVSKPVLLADGLWWVGSGHIERNLQCNPYLLIQERSVVLFDPGSPLDFETVVQKVRALTPVNSIDAIVCSHQDPDLCGSLPLFEKAGFKGVYCCHQRTANIIRYYKIDRPFYYVDFQNYIYPLADGSKLRFLPAPYLHFPGAIMSYLPKQKVLISGDLFGSIGTQWELFAPEDYEEGMKTFHEAYMPSNTILRPVMEQLSHYEITMICPQHGSVISKNTSHYIDVLKQLQCGMFMNPVHKQLLSEGGHLVLCNQIVKRYITVFGASEVKTAFARSAFTYNATRRMLVKTTLAEAEIWSAFFDHIHERKGMSWITIVAPLVELLSKEYLIALPSLYRTLVFDAIANLDSKDSQLKEIENQKVLLEGRLQAMEQSLFRDSVTGLYNELFHQVFVKEAMSTIAHGGASLHFLMVSIDNLAQINLDFGSAEGDATMRTLAALIGQYLESTSQFFRFAGAIFGIYYTGISRDAVVEKANEIRSIVADSAAFIVPITLSIGLFSTTEIPDSIMNDTEQMKNITIQTARYRLRLAQKKGGGNLATDSVAMAQYNSLFTVLLIDNPGLGRDLIKRALEQEQYRVIVVDNGLDARRVILEEPPSLILSELMVPKVHAITLRKELLARPETRKIPFLLMSSTKNESTVGRALDVQITHFFWRPVMMVELLGVVKLIVNRLQIQGN